MTQTAAESRAPSRTRVRSRCGACPWPRGLQAGLTVVRVGSRARAPLIPDRHWLGRASELPRHGFGPKVDGPEFK